VAAFLLITEHLPHDGERSGIGDKCCNPDGPYGRRFRHRAGNGFLAAGRELINCFSRDIRLRTEPPCPNKKSRGACAPA